MAEDFLDVGIVSGYFGPLHVGHLDMFLAARRRNNKLFVIVNNDAQQERKKGRVIQPAADRLRIVEALWMVDEAMIAVDTDNSIAASLDQVRDRYPRERFGLEFCNGGDRRDEDSLPELEAASARRNDILLAYGIGGTDKADSSTRLLAAMSQ